MTAARRGLPALAAALALLLDTAGAIRGGTGNIAAMGSTAADVHIPTYVINLDKRVDRCKCMQHQLGGKTWPLNRKSANGECPDLPKATAINHPAKFAVAERSLFCQNYQIWLDANKSDAEYVVILEDDALLADDFFDRVNSLVTTCQGFDYLQVDPIVLVPALHQTEIPQCPGVFKHEGGFLQGTSVQIIRRTFLPTLIQKAELVGWGAMDDWWQKFLPDQRAYAWMGSVNIQASVGKRETVEKRLQELGCDWSVTGSDIGMGKLEEKSRWLAGAIQPLVCAVA